MQNVKIKKASIKDGIFLDVEYEETFGENRATVKKSCKAPVHEDLVNAFQKLDEHFCKLGSQYDDKGSLDIDNIKAKGFVVGGSGDHEGVTLIGGRDIEHGYLNIVAPFTKWDSDYEDISYLGEAIDDCINEVRMYLFEGKQAPQFVQSEMEFEEDLQ